jgi:TolA-binding protein
MSNSDFIPAGRTSLVVRGADKLQIQTEYASRPYPRITTTVLNSGQVLHKIEKKLRQPIGSIEEQNQMQDVMARQHTEVVAIIDKQVSGETARAAGVDSVPPSNLSLRRRLESIPRVQKVFLLDNQGNFIDQNDIGQFSSSFGPIFKSLHELLQVFIQLPGAEREREQGVYEVERDRLYLVSTGSKMYFVVVGRADPEVDYEKAVKKALTP